MAFASMVTNTTNGINTIHGAFGDEVIKSAPSTPTDALSGIFCYNPDKLNTKKTYFCFVSPRTLEKASLPPNPPKTT